MLTATRLSKGFGGKPVIRGLSFAWSEPGIRLVAGSNGVGKSTLLAMLAGALVPDAGEVRIAGASLPRDREGALRCLSYCPADSPVFPFLTGREWLDFVRSVRGRWDPALAGELTDVFRLRPHLDVRFDRMSLGTARKVLLLGAFAVESEVLILDEPANGLDAGSLAALRDILRRQAANRLIVLTCHESAQLGIHPADILLLQ